MTVPCRLRDIGLTVGSLPTGPFNAITDVAGVLVGHATLVEGETIRTGATAIRAHAGNLFRDKVPAGLAIFNGFGKFSGVSQIRELGEIETPVVLTNTLAVGRGIEAINRWTLRQPGNERLASINAVVGETNDARLSDIRAGRPTVAEIEAAIDAATDGPVAEGAVGGGTGTTAFGYKAGIGTSSRRLAIGGDTFTLGVLVQANYGGELAVLGRPVGHDAQHDRDGSVLVILATDAPLASRTLERLANRAFAGIARTGSAFSHGSGDYALAFSTAEAVRRTPERRRAIFTAPVLGDDLVSPLFVATIDATEEAVLNALLAAGPMSGTNANTGKPSHIPGLDPDAVRQRFPAQGSR
jgi:D-aminopeptidase